jgi:protocatechuate 3,4-dioxygenase alpha subunit
VTPEPTPSQTVGPFFHEALLDEDRSEELVLPDHRLAVRIEGKVYDGAGEPVPDAMVEIWQANESGRYIDPTDYPEDLPHELDTFSGFGRSGTDAEGRFSFVTVRPGPIPNGSLQAPHIMVSVFARGLLKRLVTRIYFPDEEESNARDPVLSSIEDPEFRKTLVAHDEGGALRFDVHLQGDNQTAFFEL